MSATSAYRNSNMNLQKWVATVGGIAVLILSLTPTANAKPTPAEATICSPVNGQWYFGGKPGPIITQNGKQLSVDMSVYGRPTATGNFLNKTQIKVTFPDDATFIGTLNRRGQISWDNGTLWEARDFAGTWKFLGRPGPIVTQTGDQLSVDMSAYGRPVAKGTVTPPSAAKVNFPDDGTFGATLVSPSCIKWTNTTIWTK